MSIGRVAQFTKPASNMEYKSCLQVTSYSCKLLYLKQSNHSHWKVVNSVREWKEFRDERKSETPDHKPSTTDGRELISYFHSFKASSRIPAPKTNPFPLPVFSLLFWTVRLIQTLGFLSTTSTFQIRHPIIYKTIFRGTYTYAIKADFFIGLHAY